MRYLEGMMYGIAISIVIGASVCTIIGGIANDIGLLYFALALCGAGLTIGILGMFGVFRNNVRDN